MGTVCISVWRRTGQDGPDGRFLTRRTQMPGSRADVRDRSVTVAMHLLRRVLISADGD